MSQKTKNKQKKRNILMITPYIPRLSVSGGQNSSYYSIKYLSSKNDITLICFSRDREGLKDIKKYCKKVIVVQRGKTWDLQKILYTGFGTYPFLVTNYISKDFKNAIKKELKEQTFELIHCDCFYPMPNIPKTKIPIVLVDLTIEYAVYQHYVETLKGWKKFFTPLLWIDVLKLKYWEKYYWKNTHTVVAFGKDDQKLISKITKRNDIQVFQNGVDKKFYLSKPKTKKSPYPSILFGVSNMKWMQNRESVEMIMSDFWPEIKKAIPDCKFYIVGRFAPDYYSKYISKDIIVTEADSDGGPKDPQYYYNLTWILLSPMGSGGGTRNKFLEAMACEVPVIATPVGGIVDFIRDGETGILTRVNDIEQLCTEMVQVLADIDLKRKLINNGRNLVIERYSWDGIAQKMNQLY